MAERAGVLPEHLIITYDRRRIFPSTSPHGLGVWAEADLGKSYLPNGIILVTQVPAEACKVSTFEYFREHRHRSISPVEEEDPILSQALSPPPSQSQPGPSSDGLDAEDDDKFKLIIRSAVTKPITLTVRPSTKCGAIVKAFLKAAGLPDNSTPPGKHAKGRGKQQAQSGPCLRVDGDKMDPETQISVAELEDGDQVEIVGL